MRRFFGSKREKAPTSSSLSTPPLSPITPSSPATSSAPSVTPTSRQPPPAVSPPLRSQVASDPRVSIITESSATSSSDASSSLQTPLDDTPLEQPHRTPKRWTSWISGGLSMSGKKKGKDKQANLAASRDLLGVDWRPKPDRPNSPTDTLEDDTSETGSSWSQLSSNLAHPTVPQVRASQILPPRTSPRAQSNLHALTLNSLNLPPSLPPLLNLPSVPLFPRSCNSTLRLQPASTTRSEMFKKRILRRLEAHDLTTGEDQSISPFGSRARPTPSKPALKLNTEEAVSPDIGGGGWSRGLNKWAKRPCFEERVVIFTPEGMVKVATRPDIAVAELEFSEGLEALAGLFRIQEDVPPLSRPTPSPLQIQTRPQSQMISSSFVVTSRTPKAPLTAPARLQLTPKRGVRFAIEEPESDEPGDSVPLGVVVQARREREERQRRLAEEKEEQERRQREEERKKRKLAEEVAAARERRELQRTPGNFGSSHALREIEKRDALPPPAPLYTNSPSSGSSSPSRTTPPTTLNSKIRRGSEPASSMPKRKPSIPDMDASILKPRPESISGASMTAPRRTGSESGIAAGAFPPAFPAWPMPMPMPMGMGMGMGVPLDPRAFNAMFTEEGFRPWMRGAGGGSGSSTPGSSDGQTTPPSYSYFASSSEDVRGSPSGSRGRSGSGSGVKRPPSFAASSSEDVRHQQRQASGSGSGSGHGHGRNGHSSTPSPGSASPGGGPPHMPWSQPRSRDGSRSRGDSSRPRRESTYSDGSGLGDAMSIGATSVRSLPKSFSGRPSRRETAPPLPTHPSYRQSIASSTGSTGLLPPRHPLPPSFSTDAIYGRQHSQGQPPGSYVHAHSTSDLHNSSRKSAPRSGARQPQHVRRSSDDASRPAERKPQRQPPTSLRQSSSPQVPSNIRQSWNPAAAGPGPRPGNVPKRTVVQ